MNDTPLPNSVQARIRSSAQTDLIDGALSSAQGEFPPIEKKKTAKVHGKTEAGAAYNYSYKYADIGDVLAAVRPSLSKHKIAFLQVTAIEQGEIVLYTRLSHAGQWYETEYPVGSYQRLSHQKLGAALTYSRRYAGCAILGVAGEEDVDSGDPVSERDHISDVSPQRAKPRPAPTVTKSSSGNGEKKELPPVAGGVKVTPSKPEAFLAQVEQALSGIKTEAALDELWNDKFSPLIDELSTENQVLAIEIHDKHKERLSA